MSRVTITDIRNTSLFRLSPEELETYKNVAIVPRKMVEMIIEKAKEECADVNNSYYSRKINNIWEYAEELLKQFEEVEE